MKDGLMLFCFSIVFLGFSVSSIVNREHHQETLDAIHKLEYKVDSLQIKYDSLQNILKYNYGTNRS